MHIRQHSHTLYLYRDVSIDRKKHAQMKIKGDVMPLYLTVIEFLSPRTTLDLCCDVKRDRKFFRVTLFVQVYHKYTVRKTKQKKLLHDHLIFRTIITSKETLILPVLILHRLHHCLAPQWSMQYFWHARIAFDYRTITLVDK